MTKSTGKRMRRNSLRVHAVKIAALYRNGLSREKIAAEFNCASCAIQKILNDSGVKMRTRSEAYRNAALYGPRHHSWIQQGKLKYTTAHNRVVRLRGKPSLCDACMLRDPGTRYHWANRTGNYDDIWDYDRLCAHCHTTLDRARREELRLKSTRTMEAA